jgi:uroporphyrinogen decarboxylase
MVNHWMTDQSGITPRQRVLAAIERRELDRVPLFYRSIPEVDARLRRDLNLADDEALMRYLEIDFRWVQPRYAGPSLDVAGVRQRKRNIWGVVYEYQKTSAGSYWGTIREPLKDVTDPAELDDYPWPQLDWFDFSGLKEDCERYAGFAIMTAAGPASPGIMTPIQDMIGMERVFTDPVLNPEFFSKLVEKVLAFNVPLVARMFEAADGKIDFLRIGDDYAGQQGLLMSIDMWKGCYRDGLVAISSVAKEFGAKYYQHCCGGVRQLIPEFIEIGVDVLDPIQVLAAGMDPAALKREFGDRITFSGGIDEQNLLPNGSPGDVRAEVRRLCDIMAPGGGYFVGSTHNFQEDIPTENIVAMYEAARQWGYCSQSES